MVRLWVTFLLSLSGSILGAQQISMSVGLHTGITSTYVIDDGISKDPRYKGHYNVKFAPIGASIGVDYENFGIVLTPGLINIGQDFYTLNTLNGQNGDREINLKYINIPAAFKVHIIKLAFLKISGLVSFSAAYLLDGEERITHSDAKMFFPQQVYPILPNNYIVQYDGVAVPDVPEYIMAEKKDFRSVQLFAGAGFRSDWDVSNHWRVTFDIRVNYGLKDPRADDYLSRLNAYQNLYDIPGKRRDMFGQLSVGICRYIDIEKSDQERRKKLKASSRGYKPAKVGKSPRARTPKS